MHHDILLPQYSTVVTTEAPILHATVNNDYSIKQTCPRTPLLKQVRGAGGGRTEGLKLLAPLASFVGRRMLPTSKKYKSKYLHSI